MNIPGKAIAAAKEAMREVAPPPGVSKADWLAEHGDFALIAGAIAAAAPYMLPENRDKRVRGMSDDRYAPRFGRPVSGWYRWFAWRPVETVDRGRVWLRLVHRRRIYKHQYLVGGADWWFQHAISLDNPYRSKP